jgi:hypothetical protein
MSDDLKTGLYSDGTANKIALSKDMAFLHRLMSMAEHGDELFKLIPEELRTDEVKRLHSSMWGHVTVLHAMYKELYQEAGYTIPESKWSNSDPVTVDEFLGIGGDDDAQT